MILGGAGNICVNVWILDDLLISAMALKQSLLLILFFGPLNLLNFLVYVSKICFRVIQCSCPGLDKFFDFFKFFLRFRTHVLHLIVVLTHSLLYAFLTRKYLSVG